ncbi:hypothetical protein QF031_002961 [Pseudarthrobacter defluvii]|nr:hypothetical protein [Pseudarthrobacter defluvii]
MCAINHAGSTAGALAHELRGFDRLSVTTTGINTLQELADSEGIEVDCLGGRLRGVSQSFVGPLAEAALERPFHPWARLALPWTLVTDDGADPAQVQKFRDAGAQVEVAAVAG